MSKPRYGLDSAAAELKGGDNLLTPSLVDAGAATAV